MWKPIKFNPNYEINEFGEIRSIPRNGTIKDYRILAQHIDKYGYPIVGLRQDGKKKTYAVHRLVAQHFLPEKPTPKHQINHIDGNKLNNHYSNLEWVTNSENQLHAIRLGLRKECTNRHPVKQIDPKTNQVVAVYKSLREAEQKTGITWTHISAVVRKVPHKHTAGGYKWETFND